MDFCLCILEEEICKIIWCIPIQLPLKHIQKQSKGPMGFFSHADIVWLVEIIIIIIIIKVNFVKFVSYSKNMNFILGILCLVFQPM